MKLCLSYRWKYSWPAQQMSDSENEFPWIYLFIFLSSLSAMIGLIDFDELHRRHALNLIILTLSWQMCLVFAVWSQHFLIYTMHLNTLCIKLQGLLYRRLVHVAFRIERSCRACIVFSSGYCSCNPLDGSFFAVHPDSEKKYSHFKQNFTQSQMQLSR